MAAPRTYTSEQRAAINELVNNQGTSVAQTQRILANGYENLPPFKPNRDTIDAIARKAREVPLEPIETLPLTDALDQLGRESLAIIGRRLAQVREQPGKFDANEVLTIMRALSEAKGLVKGKAQGKSTDKPTFLEAVTTNADTPNVADRPGSPVSARAAA